MTIRSGSHSFFPLDRLLNRLLGRLLRLVQAAIQRFGLDGSAPPGIPDSPHLPPEVIARLETELGRDSVFLEYGCGGSTLFALKRTRLVVSVDNHWPWFDAVRRHGQRKGGGCLISLYVNTGLTSDWGYPVLRTQTSLRRWRCSRYPSKAWSFLRRYKIVPDVILVDGRFRVACVLRSILELPTGAKSLFVLDDYATREDAYDAILPFIAEREWAGRALLFRKADGTCEADIRAALRKFEVDPR